VATTLRTYTHAIASAEHDARCGGAWQRRRRWAKKRGENLYLSGVSQRLSNNRLRTMGVTPGRASRDVIAEEAVAFGLVKIL